MDIEFYKALKYPITIHEDPDDGYVGMIEDLPGCMTQAETLEELEHNMEEARLVWLEAASEDGQQIPLPRDLQKYTGKFLVRVTRSLHGDLVHAAKREGVSLNHYVAALLAAGVQSKSQHVPPLEALGDMSAQVGLIDRQGRHRKVSKGRGSEAVVVK